MAILGNSFSDLRRVLGIGDTARAPYSLKPFPNIGLDYLNSNEGANPFYELYASSMGPAGGVVRRNSRQIEDRYKVAAAADPQLTRDKFLSNFDVNSFSSGLTPQERGENPRAYQGSYRLIRG